MLSGQVMSAVEQTVLLMLWFLCTSSMLMNVQLGRKCFEPSRVFLSCRNTDMFHTCKTMTLYQTWGEIYFFKNSRFGSACSTLFILLHFPFFRLSFCPFDQDISAFEKLLNWTRQEGKSFEGGGFSSKSNWIQLDLRLEMKRESLTKWWWWEVALFTRMGCVMYSFVALPVMPARVWLWGEG